MVALSRATAKLSDTARTLRVPVNRGVLATLVIGLLIIESLTVAGVVISQQVKTNQALDVHTRQLLADVVEQTRESAQSFLGAGEDAVLLAQHLLAEDLLSLGRPHQMERYFLSQLEIASHLDGLYFADADGQFLFVKRDDTKPGSRYVTKHIDYASGARQVSRVWRDTELNVLSREMDPVDTYEPTGRPWYVKAQASDEAVWTDPYIFFTSKRPGLTVASRVLRQAPGQESGEFTGVVGADIELTSLSAFLTLQDIGETGAAFITNRDGEVLAYPQPARISRRSEDGRLRLARLDELDPVTTGAARQFRKYFEDPRQLDGAHFDLFEFGGKRYRSVFVPFMDQSRWPWVIGVYAPEEEFAGSIRQGQRDGVLVAIGVSIAVTLLALFLGPMFMRPLARLQHQARNDPLTAVLNRRGFDELTRGAVAKSLASGEPLSAVMLDIDHFKRVNDTYGHAVGDEVLEAIAKRLRNNLSKRDVLARHGGEEFAILLPATDKNGAAALAERLRKQARDSPVATTGGTIGVTISLGVAELREGVEDVDALLALADEALYAAKRGGRDRVVLADAPAPVLSGNLARA